MSYSPQALGFLAPTGGSFPAALPVCQANSSSRLVWLVVSPGLAALSPKLYAVFVPARQQYSHSASVGSRISSSIARSLAARSNRVIFLQKSCASSNENISAEFRGPCHLLGLLPITASYKFCGTSYLAIEKL